MNREYYVFYKNNGDDLEDILNTFETIMFLIICRFNKKIDLIRIERGEFYE